MADKATTANRAPLSVNTVVNINLAGYDTQVSIIAGSAQELLDTLSALTGKQTGNGPNTASTAGPSTPAPAQATATPEKAPTSAPTAPQEAAPAPSPQATAPAPEAATAPVEPTPANITLEDVYAKARTLLGTGEAGEAFLKDLLTQAGAVNISTLPEQYYQWAYEQITAQGV